MYHIQKVLQRKVCTPLNLYSFVCILFSTFHELSIKFRYRIRFLFVAECYLFYLYLYDASVQILRDYIIWNI